MMSARIIADSIHWKLGTRLTTFEVSFPRWILSEFNTHRLLSRNSASSRAIPIKANIENILADTAMPVVWGVNQAGMVADVEASEEVAARAKSVWYEARDAAIKAAQALSDLGIHKQIANRLIENFTYQKVIVSATEWDNFFWLRCHKDAQPEIKLLGELMLKAYNESTPEVLYHGEWHTPYVAHSREIVSNRLVYLDGNALEISVEEAQKISASCCAQVSYRKSDESLDKAIRVFDMLNLEADSDAVRKHASPVEHQATPVILDESTINIEGATHEDHNGDVWSANFKNWIQFRHLFDEDSCKKHPEIITKGT
jgi:thymidylate synthase ThyX